MSASLRLFCQGITIDAALITISGILSITAFLQNHHDVQARRYNLFVIGLDGYDVISPSCVVVGLIGVASIALAIHRTLGSRAHSRFESNKYIIYVLFTMLFNFVLGLLVTEYKSKAAFRLEDAMRGFLKESILTESRLGVGYRQTEIWDTLQLEMKCCGVEGYTDYIQLRSAPQTNSVPQSCCVSKVDSDGQPIAQNLGQCMLDASRRVHDSVFLHSKGCMSPLSLWLTRFLGRMTAMLFASITLQAAALLYLSWQGYRNSALSRDMHH